VIWYVLLKSFPLNVVPFFASSGKWIVSYRHLYNIFVYKKLNLILTKELRGTNTDLADHVNFYQCFFLLCLQVIPRQDQNLCNILPGYVYRKSEGQLHEVGLDKQKSVEVILEKPVRGSVLSS